MKKFGIKLIVHQGPLGKWHCNPVELSPFYGSGNTKREAVKAFEKMYKAHESEKKNKPVSVARFRPVRGKSWQGIGDSL